MSVQANLEIAHNAFANGDALTARNAWINVLKEDRGNWQATANMAMLLLQTGYVKEARAVATRAVGLPAPSREAKGEAWHNLGYIEAVGGNYRAAVHALQYATWCNEKFYPSWHWLGVCRTQTGDFEMAINAFDKALELAPTEEARTETIDKRGLALLGNGDYVAGLMDNKIRWSVLVSHPLMHSNIPQWQGESLDGKSICVLHEQGYGDTFQFVRFVPKLKEMGAERVILSVRAEMKDVLEASLLADEVLVIGEVPECDYIVPMMTLPAYLGLKIETIPFEPYLVAPARQFRLPLTQRARIGLCWAGKPMYANDQWRSMPLQALLPLFESTYETHDFYSLQVDERVRELKETGMEVFITDLSPHLKTWGDTAHVLRQLDALVSVDTGIAHLAGGMDVPVHLMIAEASCWRWHAHHTQTTPWYPRMRLHRQAEQGDWDSPVTSVLASLRK
jgi:hypothetical protein